MVKSKISVIGLGKLGLPMALNYDRAGYEVIGIDLNSDLVDKINSGENPYQEPGVSDLLRSVRPGFRASPSMNSAMLTDISFIIVPTPSLANGYFSNQYVESAIRSLATELRNKSDYHLVVITSTVMPGTTEEMGRLLEVHSGKILNYDFGVCYNPEFIALGSVLKDLQNPDFVLIGESNKYSGDLLETLYRDVLRWNDSTGSHWPTIRRMSTWNAELAKISLNTFCTMKMAFANLLADLCETVIGGNVDSITEAIGLDPRIGKKFLKGALSYGGPCFPRDNRALGTWARNQGVDSNLPGGTDSANKEHTERLANTVIDILKGDTNKKVSILGCTYKPGTDIIEESAVINLARILGEEGFETHLHDPKGIPRAKIALGELSQYYEDGPGLDQCVYNSDLCIIGTPWQVYSLLEANYFKVMGCKAILDCWRVYKSEDFKNLGIGYHAIGVGPSE